MKALITLIALLLLISGCYKDSLDVAKLNNNPFDRDYVGEAIFEYDTTFLQTVNIGGSNVVYQVIEFRVREELFLAPAAYTVKVRDLQSGNPNATATPIAPGSDKYRYQRAPAAGQEVCLELRLSNNENAASAEVICATL